MKKLIKKMTSIVILSTLLIAPVLQIQPTHIQAQSNADVDWKEIETTVRQYLDADSIEMLYSANVEEDHTYSENDITVTLHNYAYYKVENVDRSYKLWFDDQKEIGGVIVLDVSFDNNSSDTVYHGNQPEIDFTASDLYANSTSSMLDEIENDFDPTDRTVDGKSSKRGFFGFAVSPSAMEGLEEDGTALVDLFAAYKNEGFDSEDRLLDQPKAVIALTEDAEDQIASFKDAYPDRTIEDNMGTRELLDSAEDVGAEVESEGVRVEVEGYQFINFTPNAAEANRFSNFDSGVVLANIKINIYNETEETIDHGGIYGNLILGNMVKLSNEGILEKDYYGEIIEPGDMGTYHMVFTMEKDMYDKFAEDPFSVVLNVKNTDFKDLHDYEALTVMVERE